MTLRFPDVLAETRVAVCARACARVVAFSMASAGGPGDDEDDGMDFFEMLGIKNRNRMDGMGYPTFLPRGCVWQGVDVHAPTPLMFSS